ncbi:BTAD domain-containing putative transcriptional regulator [Nocardiopsis rhodophaea]|uniref:BTAD domain-containing putative transcriptional regulator n=1 Tax=Nocardiopsis rhodophaea TaxID=280238 RepID=A0ABP5DXG9_9ACTN
MRFSILGPATVRDDAGETITIGGARLRRLLVLLLLSPGRTVGTDRLIDGIWGGEAPASAGNALQALVSRLRRVLGDEAPLYGDATGYRLDVPPDRIDLHEFDTLVERGRRARAEGDPRTAQRLLGEALDLWRGPALADLSGPDGAEDVIVRMEGLRRAAITERLSISLDLGAYAEALPEIEALVAREPLREQPVELLIRALAGCGRQADALAAYERLRRGLADELGIDPSEHMRELHVRLLRGELEPQAPEGPVAADRAAEVSAPRPAITRLPHILTSFIAREEEVRDAVGQLCRERLVTLIGPGGAGKTRLSIETGARFAEEHADLAADGVWFVELAPVSEGANLTHAVLNALGLRELWSRTLSAAPASGGSDDPVERIIEVLAEQRLLVILDNCEHVIVDAARLIERLLAACPGLRILTTSREPLALAGERLLPVPSLALPPEHTSAASAGNYASVRLFVERAAAVTPGFALDDSNVDPVVRICRELDGMPLALELAAARVRVMPVAQLAVRLSDRFRLLTSGSRFALPRHQTLQAVVDWSWELLDEPERTLMHRLSVFPGGATLESVARVCSDGPGDTIGGRDVWSVLFALVDKSLVVCDGSSDDGADPRYRQLETVRAYGAQRLAESGEEDPVRRAHAEHMLRLWSEADPHLRGAEQLTWLSRVRAEHDNFTAALRWAIDRRDVELALDLSHAAQWYWQMADDWAEPGRWSAEILRLAGDTPPEGREVAYAECLFMVSIDHGNADEQLLLRITEVLEGAGERAEDHRGLVFVPIVLAMFGHDLEGTMRRLDARAERQEPWLRATTRAFVGVVAMSTGQARMAQERLTAALEEFRVIGDRWGTSQSVVMLSELVRLGDLEEEVALLDEAVTLAEEMELTGMVRALKARQAASWARMGRVDDARRVVAEAHQLTGISRDSRTMLLLSEADVERSAGNPARSRELLLGLTDDINAFAPIVRAHVEPMWHVMIASACADLGDVDEAWRRVGLSWRALAPECISSQVGGVLECLAGLVAEREPERAGTFLGYAEAIRGLPNVADPAVGRIRQRIRRRLGDAGFAQAYDAGAATAPEKVFEVVGAWLEEAGPR